MLAACANAFLGGRRAGIGTLFDAGEDVLELHHPGIGEHQGRIIARHERRRRHDFVVVACEKVEKSGPDFVYAAHSFDPATQKPKFVRSRRLFDFAACLARPVSGNTPAARYKPQFMKQGALEHRPRPNRKSPASIMEPGPSSNGGTNGSRGPSNNLAGDLH